MQKKIKVAIGKVADSSETVAAILAPTLSVFVISYNLIHKKSCQSFYKYQRAIR